MIYRFVPGFGDEIVSHRNASRDPASRAAAAVVSSPAALVRQGINTHSARGGGGQSGGGDGGGAQQPAGQVSGGMAAHSSRGGGAPARQAPPAPRTYDRSAPPRPTKNGSTGNRTGGDRR
ncbi:MAG TPA: hypothetical protein VGO89_22730, partial [Streptomyces sp.]|jgi:hypothetical protein|nr:hypothetical protein [Streptomyces sp.]